MVQRLRALTALPEDLNSIPTLDSSQSSVTPALGDLSPLVY